MAKALRKINWWKIGGGWFLLVGIVSLAFVLSKLPSGANTLALDLPNTTLLVLFTFETVLTFLIAYLYFQKNQTVLTLTVLYAFIEGGLKIILGETSDKSTTLLLGGIFSIAISLFIAYKAKQTKN